MPGDSSCISRVLTACALGSPAENNGEKKFPSFETKPRTFLEQFSLLSYCSGGLLVSYLLWGLLQERIMAIEYVGSSSHSIDQTTSHLGGNSTAGEKKENTLTKFCFNIYLMQFG